MASTSVVSETEINYSADNVEVPLIENNETSYMNDWVDLTVNEVIERGAKLREENKRQSPTAHKTYVVVNLNSKKSPSESSDKSLRKRKRTRRIIKTENRSCGSCRSIISHTQRTPDNSCSTQSSRSRSRVRSCPLRIAELAVPSKRYCMATWRDNSETLPIVMVEKLKKYVMDESAVVQVSDAITCFQRKRKAPRSCKKKKVPKDKSKVCLTSLKNTQYMLEIRDLCAIFGHKLAKKLILPMDIALNSDWQRVSNVVSEEIAKLMMKDKTRFCSEDNHFNKGVREEISNKVAVWIATILEDTSCKLLEEDLRVKKNEERRSGQDENLVTVIENHLISCHRGASELDEEEGPALDFIDDLVNNVMDACTTYSDTESYSDGRSASEQSLSHADSSTDMCYVKPEQTTDQSNESKGETIQEILDDLMADIIAPVSSDEPTIDGYNKTKDSGEHMNTEPILNFESDPLTNGEEIQYEDAEMNNDKSSPIQNSIALEGTRDDINLFNPVVNDQDDIKVSEVLVVLAGEEPLDDKNKKVKFTDLSMVARGGIIEYSRENSIDSNSKSNLIPNLSWVMSFTNKPDILIGPPNEHLLSDADESWPEDITTPMLRVSESVSRSVTSLGRIIESEEKVSNPQDEENMKQQAQIVEGLVEHRVKTIEPDHHTDNATDQRTPIDNDAVVAVDNRGDDARRISMENIGIFKVAMNCIKVEVSDQATNTVRDGIPERTGGIPDNSTGVMEDGDLSDISSTEPLQDIQEIIKVEINQIKSKQIIENEITSSDDKKGEIKDTKPYAAITNSKLISGEALLKNVEKGDHNDDVNSEENLILKAVQQIIELPYVETKIDYRVDPRTAPAWVIYNLPSEDSHLDFSKVNETRKLKESEVRKWCKDLEQSFINLEQWNNWIENTCKQILFYKQRGEVNKLFAPNARINEGRHWVKLKRTVNRDAVLWTKLSMRTQEILEKYRFVKRMNEEVYEILLNRKQSSEGSLLKALDEFDRHRLWLHRLIVSTEYCVKCNCKTFSRN